MNGPGRAEGKRGVENEDKGWRRKMKGSERR